MSITLEGEFRYIVQWFMEFSEIQRDDFVPIFLESLNVDPATPQINGIINSTAALSNRPMSLFQCRMKLYREWTPKWPEELKNKLKERIMEIDEKVGEKIASHLRMLNGEVSSNAVDGDNMTNATSTERTEQQEGSNGNDEQLQQVQQEVSQSVNNGNSRLSTLAECETPDDDDNKPCDGKEDVQIILNQSEPDQPVSMHQQSIAAEVSSLAA